MQVVEALRQPLVLAGPVSLVRGVHGGFPAVYTLTLTNNTVNATNGTTVTDFDAIALDCSKPQRNEFSKEQRPLPSVLRVGLALPYKYLL